VTAQGVIKFDSLADIYRSTEEAGEIVTFNGKPAAMLTATKKSNTNVFDLMDELNTYIAERNTLSSDTGVSLYLIDDQTTSAREALSMMQNNALISFVMVLLVTFTFLGTRIATLTSIGIPFTLDGTFIILYVMDMMHNNTILLGWSLHCWCW